MNLKNYTQEKLYGLNEYFNELVYLFDKEILPNKILLSGSKGIGKSTLAYHFINYVLSCDEKFQYDLNNFKINKENKSYKLILNGTLPNFQLIDVKDERKKIDIEQIRNLILYSIKSSFNQKPRFILIDNIEKLNKNAVNALLKVLEEPNLGVHFILINNNKKVLSTLKSRCLEFKIHITHQNSIDITNKILGINILKEINSELLNFYQSPGTLCSIYYFSKEYKIDLKNLSLKNLLEKIIYDKLYKKNDLIKIITMEYVEMYFLKKIYSTNNNMFNLYSYFIKYLRNINRYNLDEESFFIEFKSKVLDG